MEARFTKTVRILPSRVDVQGRLGVAHTFDLFMDTATEAAEAIGVGWDMLMRRGLFWITVKTRIEFIDMPGLLDTVQVITWPERPGEMRCDRCYELRRGERLLARGKTEWAIVSVKTGKPQPLADILPPALDYPDASAWPEPFPMIDGGFADPPFAEHRVTATDIDMARHMNNVAYVRAIQDAFTVQEWQAMHVRQMDVIFLASAHEGDTLQFHRRRKDDALDICGSLPDGSPSVMARLTLG